MSSILRTQATSLLYSSHPSAARQLKERFIKKGYRLSLADVDEALQLLDPDMSREAWVRLAASLHSAYGDEAMHVFEEWSRKGASYSARDFRAMWKSLPKFNRISIGTFLHAVHSAGWRKGANDAPSIRNQSSYRFPRSERRSQDIASRSAFSHLLDEWLRLPVANPEHPYLRLKRIAPFNLRQNSLNQLVVPLSNGRDLTGIQFISDRGKKWYWNGTKKIGSFYMVGLTFKAPRNTPTVGICEGVATGHSLHTHLAIPVYCAMDAGNLTSVAIALRARYPAALLTLYADNDAHGTGQRKARQAAAAVPEPTTVWMPKKRGTDWNDFVNEQMGAEVAV
jgi:putative DNA primase/helicase